MQSFQLPFRGFSTLQFGVKTMTTSNKPILQHDCIDLQSRTSNFLLPVTAWTKHRHTTRSHSPTCLLSNNVPDRKAGYSLHPIQRVPSTHTHTHTHTSLRPYLCLNTWTGLYEGVSGLSQGSFNATLGTGRCIRSSGADGKSRFQSRIIYIYIYICILYIYIQYI